MEAREHGVTGAENRSWDITGWKSAYAWQNMQMYVPGFFSVQAEMDPLRSKHLHVCRRRAAHYLTLRCGLLHGQSRNILTMALEHNESLAGRQQRRRAQKRAPSARGRR